MHILLVGVNIVIRPVVMGPYCFIHQGPREMERREVELRCRTI